MAHVASDLKSKSLNRLLPQAGKRSYAADTKAATPFDSVLDDTARAAPEPRQTRPSDDKTPRAERPERTKSADRPDRAAKSDDTAKPSEAAPVTNAAAPADSKTADAATAEPAEMGDKAKATADKAQQAGEAKPSDAADSVAIAVLIDPAITAATVQANATDAAKAETKGDSAAIAATAVTAKTAEAATAAATTAEAGTDAALAEGAPGALAALAAKAEKTDKADKKTDDKPAVAAKTAGKAQTPLHPDAATQTASTEPHKNSGAHASAEETANSHRGVTADRPAPVAADTTATIAPKATDLAPPPTFTVTAPAHAAQATAAAAATAPAQTSAADAPVPLAGVAFEITSKVMSGKNQFDIRLDPAELGRIHVRMDVDRDGNVVTHMMADRHDTLDMLRRDTAGLERALQDAGLKTSDNSLQFSLRDQQANQQQSHGGSNSTTASIVVEDEQITGRTHAAQLHPL